MRIRSEDIFTPQGKLGKVARKPNLDFLMNIFNIPRAFGVSGFGGSWNVGQHSFAAALIALFWAKFNKFTTARRDRLVTLALVHDLHEAVTGDILPMFKTPEARRELDLIQRHILEALGSRQDDSLKVDLKVVDLVAFLYEINQVSPSILHKRKLKLARAMAARQKQTLLAYCRKNKVSRAKILKFLRVLEI